MMKFKSKLAILFSTLLLTVPMESYAQSGWCAGGTSTLGTGTSEIGGLSSGINGDVSQSMTDLINVVTQAHCGADGSCAPNNTQQVITEGFDWLRDQLQTYMIGPFFTDLLSPDLEHMAQQFSSTGMAQVGIVGTFFDAKSHNDGQRLINKLHAKAHKNYQPSRALCRFGTNVRSLAATQQLARVNQNIMAERSINRHLGSKYGIGATGAGADKETRYQNYQDRYCNEADNNNRLRDVCKTDTNNASKNFFNKDIDFTRTMDSKLTLDIDLTDGLAVASDDEQDVLALSNYLYGHDVFSRPSPNLLENNPNKHNANHDRYLFSRSVIAKRNVAENSFLSLAALKSSGAVGNTSEQYLKKIVSEMGLPDAAVEEIVGVRPSYYAQMEILTKKIYQNPNFYIGLIDKPENVKRQQAAMQSFGLMQQRDLYDSLLRSEMLLSVLLEIELQDYEKEVEAKLENLSKKGPRN